jgi:hypothetical protein
MITEWIKTPDIRLPILSDTFDASDDPKAARDLARLMSELSERCCSSTWLDENEFELWDGAHGRSVRHGHTTQSERETLQRLSGICGGWIVWRPDDDGVAFVRIEEWRETLEKTRKP